MKKRLIRLSALALVTALATGCASNPPAPPPAAPPPDPSLAALARAAEEVSDSRRKLAEIRNAKAVMSTDPAERAKQYRNATIVPEGLEKPVTINWTGGLTESVRLIAQLTGYRFKVLGKAPPTGVIIRVRATKQPAIDVLHDIGSQAGSEAIVRVAPKLGLAPGVIEVDYRGRK